jgi:hypothetical protein
VFECWRGQGSECSANPPSFVKNISSLKKFKIDYKRGEIVLNNDFFHGCDQMTHVKITYSKLKNIPEDLFMDTKDLLEIDLSYNEIQNLPPKLFHHCSRFGY